MTRRRDLTLTPALVCPRTGYLLSHEWVPGDAADLIVYGQPDHGLTVRLGRCRRCLVPLLALDPYYDDRNPTNPLYEIPGAIL